jgi:two-component system, NarL family, nitrate/nitrite response regulator NarL
LSTVSILLATSDTDLQDRCRLALGRSYHFQIVTAIPVRTTELAAKGDIMLLDAVLLGSRAYQTLRLIGSSPQAARVIVITDIFDADAEVALLKAGAAGCIRRGIDSHSLRDVVSAVCTIGVWIPPTLLPRLVGEIRKHATKGAVPTGSVPRISPSLMRDLTARQSAIVKLIVQGATNNEIAAELGIHNVTVKAHLTKVFQKFGVTDRIALLARLTRND